VRGISKQEIINVNDEEEEIDIEGEYLPTAREKIMEKTRPHLLSDLTTKSAT
jgi:hypothetical protein